MNKAHKIKLYPTPTQIILLNKSCGVARFSYNWALNRWNELYKTGTKTSAYNLIKDLTIIKRTEYPWMMEVSKTCPQYAIHNLEAAFKRFFKKNAKYPKFHKKGIKDSFVAVENKEQFKQFNFKIHIPRIGKIKCSENLRFNGKVNNVVVRRVANMWFAIINIETHDAPAICENQTVVGVDMGISNMMVFSDGMIFENPRSLSKNLKSLKRLQRKLSSRKKDGKNRIKSKTKVARKHYKISCIRSNAIHQATSFITKNYGVVVIELLRPSNMIKNKNLAQAIGDISFGEIARQLGYKSAWQGVNLIKVDPWYPSSKLCSRCGNKKDLKLNQRVYKCSVCNYIIDRDLNAAKNLANLALPQSMREVTPLETGGFIIGNNEVLVDELGINN